MIRKHILRAIVLAAIVSVVLSEISLAQNAPTAGQPNPEASAANPQAGSVTPPKILKRVEPEYSEEARRGKIQGSVVLRVVVGADGVPHDIQVQRGLGHGLDENAIAALTQWRFEPGQANGQPVPAALSIEVTFRVFGGASTPKPIRLVYPGFAKPVHGLKVKGKLALSLTVDENGLPTNIKVEHSQGRRFDDQAIEAVRQWRFEPGKKDGIAVPTPYDIEFLRF